MWQNEIANSGESAKQSVSQAAELVGQASQPPAGAVPEKGSIIDQLKDGDWSMFTPLLEKYLVPAIGALVILMVSYFVARFLSRVGSAPVRRRVDETLGRFVGKIIFYTVMVFALLGVLGMFGVSVASFAAVLASVGFAVGLAFQGSLSNFAAGVLLLVSRPFKVGDVINAAGVTATVHEIDLFSTTMDTPDNRRVIVPNSSVLSGTIENHSYHNVRRVEVIVGVDYSADLEVTRQVLQAAAESLADLTVQGDGRGCQIVLGDLGSSSVNWKVRIWTRTSDYWSVKEQLTAMVKSFLDRQGIGIPFPQMDVHLAKAGSGDS